MEDGGCTFGNLRYWAATPATGSSTKPPSFPAILEQGHNEHWQEQEQEQGKGQEQEQGLKQGELN